MSTVFSIFFIVLGAIIGSFLNVVIYRMNTGRTLEGRSHCGSCNRTLGPGELIPIVSYLFQRGRCKGCNNRISARYMIIELTTAIVFFALYMKFSSLLAMGLFFSFGLWFVLSATFFSLLIVISGYDAMHKIVPDRPLLILTIVSLLSLCVHRFGGHLIVPDVMSLLAGPIVALPFFIIWLASSGRLMGFGDVKIALPLGWFLGISIGFAGLIISFWVGALVAVILLMLKKTRYGMKTELPFVPYLAIGSFLAFLFTISLPKLIGYFSLFS